MSLEYTCHQCNTTFDSYPDFEREIDESFVGDKPQYRKVICTTCADQGIIPYVYTLDITTNPPTLMVQTDD